MKRFVAFALGIAVGLALVRVLRRRASAPVPAVQDPRAEELARKLADTRAAGAPVQTGEAPGPEAEAARAASDVEVDEARRRVHEEARATAEQMRRAGGADEPGA